METIVLVVVVAVVVYVYASNRKPQKRSSGFDYREEYDRYMREKHRKMKPKRSIWLLLSTLLGLVYLVWLCVYFGGEFLEQMETAGNSEGAMLGTALGGMLIFPHIIMVALAVLFGIIGFFARSRACALVAGLFYVISIFLMPLYFLFVIVQMALAFVAYVTMRNP